jgi:two-component sensor histidine kinase
LQPAIKFSRCILFKADFSWWKMRPSLFNRSGTATAVRVLQISKRLRQHPSLGYAMAFVAVGLATLIQWLGQDQYGNAPFLTIYPAVILTTLVGGLGAGFLSAVLAGLSQWGLFIPTLRWLAVASYTFDAIVCVLLIVFIDRTLDLLLINIDQEKQAKQHQYLLATELHHRIQNLFTVIQAIIRFSLPGDGLIQQSVIKQRLMDRLQSMSATNRVITDSMGDGVRLIDLIKSGIHGFETQFEISGAPGLVLGPQMTQNFSLILHELLTNALKHGALSVPAGRVSLRLDWNSWVLTFMWQESGGPAVSPPAGAGFGSRILGDFARSFCQNVDASYAPTGFATPYKFIPTRTDLPSRGWLRPRRLTRLPQPPRRRAKLTYLAPQGSIMRRLPSSRRKSCCTIGSCIRRARRSAKAAMARRASINPPAPGRTSPAGNSPRRSWPRPTLARSHGRSRAGPPCA